MWRVIDIAGEDRHLHLHRNSLVIRQDRAEIGRIPLDDLNALIIHAIRCTITTEVSAALAARSIPVVLCDNRHMPTAITWPVSGHFEQADRIETQALMTERLRNRLWAQIIRAKIREQAATLAFFDPHGAHGLRRFASAVRSGDPDNLEARAAALYWPRLFGERFRRDQDAPDLNAALNYGYTILRSATARALAATGLTPALGLFHHNRRNPFRLVDDLMEPFRPLIDRTVHQYRHQWASGLTPDARATLAGTLTRYILTEDGESPVHRVLTRLCLSLVEVYQQTRKDLVLPASIRLNDQADLFPTPDTAAGEDDDSPA